MRGLFPYLGVFLLMSHFHAALNKSFTLMQKHLVCFFLLLLGVLMPWQGAKALSAGDIAIIGMNTDAPDKFRFLVLSELVPGTTIHFTDNGWCTTTTNSNCTAANALRNGENTLVWTTGAVAIPAGTVVDIQGGTVSGGGSITSGALNGLSSSGDQILAYEDNGNSLTFIYAVNNQGSPGTWQSDASSSKDSALPPGLTTGLHEVALDERDNYVYTGISNGTKQQLLAAISDKSNWTGQNSLAGMPSGTTVFTLLPGAGDRRFYLPSTNPATAEDNSDASTGIAIDDDFMIVGDDEANVLRVYPRVGGETVAEWSYETHPPTLTGELDLEASALSGGKYYFIGSHSNKKSGNDDDKREHLFAVGVSGTGAATTFTYNNELDSTLEADLIAWDQSNGNTYGFAASAAAGVVPEGVDGFSIEGLAEGASAGALYLGFRAPLVNTTTRDKALIVPITNAAAILGGNTAPMFGTAIELNLGGRGIRSIEKVGSEYLILAGPVGKPNPNTANNFMLFKWDGSAANAPEAYDNNLDALVSDTGGSLETIVGASATAQGTLIQLLEDNGDTVWPGQTEASKKLPAADQKFRGHWLALGATLTDNTAPSVTSTNPVDGATGVGFKTNLVLNFDEYVTAGSGSFVIKQGTNTIETLVANSSRVKVLNGVVTIDPINDLLPNTAYTVETTGTAVQDMQGNAWSGWSGANVLDFTTGASATNYPLLITEVNSKGNGGDFFELYNYGTVDVDISGWKMIDSAADPSDAKTQTFASGTVVPVGGTLLVAVKTDASTFNTAWGLGASVALVAFPNPGLGGDDAVVIFDASNQVAVAMNYGTANITATDGTVIAPAKESATNNDATSGHAGPSFGAGNDAVSAVWDGGSVSDPRYTAAANGVNGATEQTGNTATVGSPGNLPGSAFAIAATSANKDEGNSGTTPFTFTVSRTGSTAVAANVDYTVSGGSSNPADANDFDGGAFPSGTVSFAVGETSKVISIDVVGDTTDEANENFDVTLSNPTMGVTIATAKATGTIVNDDAPPATLISAIQGSGNSAALSGNQCVEAVLTAKMPGLKGFFLQEEAADSDNNPATSEGIFVYYGSNANPVASANAGDVVALCGDVAEYKRNTQLKSPTNVTVTAGNANSLPPAVVLTLPIANHADWERYEGMRVTIKSGTASGGKLVITNNHNHGRYGNLVLTSDEVLRQFTEDNLPDQAGYASHVATVQKDQIILDDAQSKSNPVSVLGLGGNPLSASNTLRAGDFVNDVEGILDQFVSGGEENYETTYRIQPTVPPVFMAGNARPTAGDLTRALSNANANIKVASVNVLNYFSNVGKTRGRGRVEFTTPYGNTMGIRGANTQVELDRQGDKLVSSMLTMDADVYGLMEIQNNGYNASSTPSWSAIGLLVKELNEAATAANLTSNGSPVVYAAVNGPFKQGNGTAPTAGRDAIMVALIYKTNTVVPVGQAAVPEAIAAYDAFGSSYGNRVPVAQSFKSKNHQETFTVAVNHFKSKGSVKQGDADTNDGQGNNPNNRLRASRQLRAWMATNPTGVNSGNHLLIGDFNGYAKEDAIMDLVNNGYPLVSSGDSYTFRGLWGSLDFVFASTAFSSKVVFGKNWAVNAPEPRVLDYNTEKKTASYYDTSAYRSSDHDPVLVGLKLTEMQPQTITNFAATPSAPVYSPNGTFTVSATGGGSGNPVVFASSTTAVCTVNGTTITIEAAGTCTLTANQAGNDAYYPATEVSLDVAIAKAPQTITGAAANPVSPMFVANGTFDVSATGGASGNAVVFASSNTAICTVSGTTVTMVSAGTCPLTINQAGNSNYLAAVQETLNVVIQSPSNLSIDTNTVSGGQALDVLNNQTIQVTGGTAPYQFSITQGNLPQGVSLNASTGELSGTPQEAGDFAFTVQVRDANGQLVSQGYTLSVAKVPQVITFNTQQPASQSFVANATFDLNPVASADSNLTVAYSTADAAICTINGSTVTMIAKGTCEVIADQPGNDLYSPAATVRQTIVLQGESVFSDGFED